MEQSEFQEMLAEESEISQPETQSKSPYEALQAAAFELGFPLFGATAALESPGFAKFCQWLDQGYAGSMDYLVKRRSAYRHPSSVLDGVKSLVMLGMPYQPAKPLSAGSASGAGRVAAYASGTLDYHDLIHQRLEQLADWLKEHYPKAKVRGVVDTAPLLEREFAALAGLGWVGKNTLLLNRRSGSYFFLAAILTDIEFEQPAVVAVDHCGSCTACLDACPTQAFPQARVLDARRCISYLTIEHRESIPVELRQSIGDWVFGCDICQQVCPWNRMAKPTREPAFQPQPELEALDLLQLLSMDDDAFRRRYRKTPLWRSRRIGLQRNAMIVLGNQRNAEALPLLVQHLSNGNPVLRQTAAWAIGRVGGDAARRILSQRLPLEREPAVRMEIVEAMDFEE